MKIGCIGVGNMGSAIAKAISLNLREEDELYLVNRTVEKAMNLAQQIPAKVVTSQEAIQQCDVVFLGIKPYQIIDYLLEYKDMINQKENIPIIVSMAGGIEISNMKSTGVNAYFTRIMPNTPVDIMQGCTAICGDKIDVIKDLLSKSGTIIEIEENGMDAFSALAGCGPAFVDMFIEALADGAVYCGIKRQQAYDIIDQLLIGTANLHNISKKHPGELKDQVCSPNGSTIQGVYALEEGNMRAAVMKAVIKAYERNTQIR